MRSLELGLETRYACMRRGKTLQCWGKGVLLPNGETASPEDRMSMPGSDIEGFAVGSDRICVVSSGTLRCWGHDEDDITPALDRETVEGPIEEVPSLLDVAEVRIHGTTVCANERSGSLVCWTYEEPLEDPYEHHDEAEEDPPWMERHEVAHEVIAFDPGEDFVCVVMAGGRLACSGSDPIHVDRADRAQEQCYDEVECDEGDEDEDEDEDEDDYCDEEHGEFECDAAYEDDLMTAWTDLVDIDGVPEPVEVAAGDTFACARTKRGHVFCWGDGDQGQLGHGTTRSSLSAVKVLDIDGAVAIDAGWAHACAVLGDGRVACWGSDRFGTVGSGTTAVATPRVIPGITEATDVVLTRDLSCAILRDGTARCWGQDPAGRVRGGGPPPRGIPPVATQGVGRLMPFGQDTCAGREDGSMVCWGQHELPNTHTVTAFAEPRPSPHAGLVQLLTVGPCARTSGDELRCWRSTAEMHEVGPTTLVVSKAVAADSNAFACAVTSDGHVHCWRPVSGKAPAPILVSSISEAVDVAVGKEHGCAVRRDGKVDCWELSATLSAPARRLPALDDAAQIAEGDGQLCVRTRAGRVRCWKEKELDEPSFDHPLEEVEAITAGTHHACALTKGQVWCWGNNGNEQLGSAAAGKSSAGPRRVPGLREVVEIAAGDAHTCARQRSGSVRCWGRGNEGQLGRLPTGWLAEPTPMLAPQWLEPRATKETTGRRARSGPP